MKVFGMVFIMAMMFQSGTAGALTPRQLLTDALKAYNEAQSVADYNTQAAAFDRSYRLFAEAAERGADNAEVYSNAGTAALRAERPAPAILAFRRALEKDPQNARARQNLTQVRGLLPAWLPKPETESVFDSFFFWHKAMSQPHRAGFAALAFMLATLAVAGSIVWPRGWLRALCVLPLLVWFALVGSIILDQDADSSLQAVVVATHAIARASDSMNSPMRFNQPLPEGTELEIVESRADWARIRLANDREAWVELSTLERVSAKST